MQIFGLQYSKAGELQGCFRSEASHWGTVASSLGHLLKVQSNLSSSFSLKERTKAKLAGSLLAWVKHLDTVLLPIKSTAWEQWREEAVFCLMTNTKSFKTQHALKSPLIHDLPWALFQVVPQHKADTSKSASVQTTSVPRQIHQSPSTCCVAVNAKSPTWQRTTKQRWTNTHTQSYYASKFPTRVRGELHIT